MPTKHNYIIFKTCGVGSRSLQENLVEYEYQHTSVVSVLISILVSVHLLIIQSYNLINNSVNTIAPIDIHIYI